MDSGPGKSDPRLAPGDQGFPKLVSVAERTTGRFIGTRILSGSTNRVKMSYSTCQMGHYSDGLPSNASLEYISSMPAKTGSRYPILHVPNRTNCALFI
jgi:hypothetical protein